jgi:hypothetical protein
MLEDRTRTRAPMSRLQPSKWIPVRMDLATAIVLTKLWGSRDPPSQRELHALASSVSFGREATLFGKSNFWSTDCSLLSSQAFPALKRTS